MRNNKIYIAAAVTIALIIMALLYRNNNNESKAFNVPILEDLSEKGNVEAMYALATLKKYGIEGVDKDHKEAISLFRRACEKKSDQACLELGWLLLISDSTHRDEFKGADVLSKLSENSKEASFRLSKYFFDVGQKEKAKLYAQKALRQGHHNEEYLNNILSH